MSRPENHVTGIAVCPGIAIGRIFIANCPPVPEPEKRKISPGQVENEIQRFQQALDRSREQLAAIRRKVAERIDDAHAEIYTAQMTMLEDVDLIDPTIEAIRKERVAADFAYHRRVMEMVALLSQIDDEYFRARDNDVLDVASRVLGNLSSARVSAPETIEPDSIVVAHDLSPTDVTQYLKPEVIALVTERGGATSHTSIMAKAMEIPAVVGVAGITSHVEHGTLAIVDGMSGKIILNPGEETIADYRKQQQAFVEFSRDLDQLRDQPAETLDGYSVTLRANVEFPEEVGHIFQHGAAGIGLFRTEFLFLNRTDLPSEKEQFELYRLVVEQAAPHPVVIRTLDIGGDKLNQRLFGQREDNPFMGQRAIRLCLKHEPMFRDQLRAILRASAFGTVRLLIPMIASLEEFVQVRKILKEVKASLRAAQIPYDNRIEMGAMIEIPSAALVADALARECDFFSIGTNDLIQYTLAVDRGNQNVAYLYDPLNPAVLRMLRMTVNAAREGGIPVSVCGEMAGDASLAMLLLGLGVDELSMSAANLPYVKRLIRSIRLSDAKAVAEQAMLENTVDGVRAVVKRHMKKFERHIRPARVPSARAGAPAA